MQPTAQRQDTPFSLSTHIRKIAHKIADFKVPVSTATAEKSDDLNGLYLVKVNKSKFHIHVS